MSPRGGFRQGAGRKPRKTPLVAWTVKLDPGLLKLIRKMMKAEKLSGPKLLAKLTGWTPPTKTPAK